MKGVLFYLILLVKIGAFAQEAPVFKLLYADSATVNGTKLERDQELSIGESVRSYGLMILVHRTGKFIAFEGDMVVNVAGSNSSILQSLQMDECTNDFPSLDLLFSSKNLRYRLGAVTAGMPDVEWVVPSNNRLIAHPKQEIALLWKPYQRDVKAFEFRVNSMFDDPIVKPRQLSDNRLVLPLDTFTVEEDIPYILVGVRSLNDEYSRVKEIGVKLSKTSYFMPDTFEFNSATKALEIGFYLEENRACEYALPYFEKALELSDHPFYKEMLANHKMRCGSKN